MEKIKTAAYAKVDNIRDEEIDHLYQDLPEGKERDIQEAYINERAESRKKTIRKLKANGLPTLSFFCYAQLPRLTRHDVVEVVSVDLSLENATLPLP